MHRTDISIKQIHKDTIMVVYLRKVFTANSLARYIVLQICFIFLKKKMKKRSIHLLLLINHKVF